MNPRGCKAAGVFLWRTDFNGIQNTARRLVPHMRAACADLINLIAPTGVEHGQTRRFAGNSASRLVEVPGRDTIRFGHSHGESPPALLAGWPKVKPTRGTIRGVLSAMPGRSGDRGNGSASFELAD